MLGLMWFREDLRIRDNTALYYAAKNCHDGVVGIYIFDHEFLKKHQVASCRVHFIWQGLQHLSRELKALNIPLLIFQVKRTTSVIHILQETIESVKAGALFFNRQYEIDEKRRDAKIIKNLEARKWSCYSYHDQSILLPDAIRTQQGHYFKIFTPYQRVWRKKFVESHQVKLLPPPKKQKPLNIKTSKVPQLIKNYPTEVDLKNWPSGEKCARQRLKKFIKEKLFQYDKDRNFPAISATSQLSPYLSAGMISARECFLAAYKANQSRLDSGNKGAITWMSELIWRDFYKAILIAAPRVSMNSAYHLATDKLPWKNNPKLFLAWCEGKTGIPIIDAAMRQLNQLGWMHNRLRMLTASFLVKNLQMDWRLGEAYFMHHLIDGDLASNNGGWQWCASSGADAMPYFRSFNPYRQSKRFDPQGHFIRQYCSELKTLTAKIIHDPNKMLRTQLGYPQPIVDLEKTAREFIAKYKKIVFSKA